MALMMMKYTEENFHVIYGVSPRVIDDLKQYQALLKVWQKSQRLVSRNALEDVWHRHFADSAQIYKILVAESGSKILDAGSGGGFPAIVCSILNKHSGAEGALHITMVDSNRKKCIFLQECIRALDLNATVLCCRIEDCSLNAFDVMTVRALASLDKIIFMAYGLKIPKILALKGRAWRREIQECNKKRPFKYTEHRSCTQSSARILLIKTG